MSVLMKQNYTRRFLLTIVAAVFSFAMCSAQGQKRGDGFNPKRFEAELEQFIVTEACLTPQESAKFFPVYRQMMKRQRMIFDEMRRYHQVNLHDNDACTYAIRRQDELDIEMKQLQQEYHGKFMLVLPACKVMRIIKAEEKFHRQMFKNMHRPHEQGKNKR